MSQEACTGPCTGPGAKPASKATCTFRSLRASAPMVARALSISALGHICNLQGNILLACHAEQLQCCQTTPKVPVQHRLTSEAGHHVCQLLADASPVLWRDRRQLLSPAQSSKSHCQLGHPAACRILCSAVTYLVNALLLQEEPMQTEPINASGRRQVHPACLHQLTQPLRTACGSCRCPGCSRHPPGV